MRILLVRPRLIGDVILTTPSIRAVRRQFPTSELLYLVESLAAPVVAVNPHLTKVLTVEYRRGWRRFRDDLQLAAVLRRQRIDIAIDFHGGPRSAWLTWATRAPVRIGYDSAPMRQWAYTKAVPRPRERRTRHSVLNQWDLIAAIDPALASPLSPVTDRVEMPMDPAAKATLETRLSAMGIGTNAEIVVLHVSARNPFRRWRPASFAALASDLVRGQPARWLVVVSGPSDHAAADRIIAHARELAPADASRIVPGEGWSLAELRAMMDRATLFVGGDSGPLHIAATSDVPIVALYGPTLPEQWAPWRPTEYSTATVDAGPLPCRPCDQRVCAPGDFRCLTRISVESVRGAAEQLLESRSLRSAGSS